MRLLGLAICSVVITMPLAALAQSAAGQPGDVQYNQSGNLAGADTLKYDDNTEQTTAKNLNKTRFLHAYATTGDGSSSNPWSLSTSDWIAVLEGGAKVSAAKGVYNLPNNGVVELPSSTRLVCDPGAIFQWPASVSAGATAMFHIPSNATGVVIRDCDFEPGISMPISGEVGGLGQFFWVFADHSGPFFVHPYLKVLSGADFRGVHRA